MDELTRIEASTSPIDAQTRRPIDMLLTHLPENVSARDVFLFGSRARQTHGPDSDADDLGDPVTGEKAAEPVSEAEAFVAEMQRAVALRSADKAG